MIIENSTDADIDKIFRLYAQASAYQRLKKTVVVWPQFEWDLVATEIAERRQWKLMIEDEIACVWATTFNDAQIWEERDSDPSVYIHRIATNPAFRGNNFIDIIVNWAKAYAKKNDKHFVRLDTLGNNVKLIDHYKRAGFNFLGMYDLKNTAGLPGSLQNSTSLPL